VSGLLHVIAAGEPSKAIFYLSGAALALWAVVLTAIGLARADFPASQAISRGTMAITAALMAAVMVTAIATASRPEEHETGERTSEGSEAQKPLEEGQAGGTSGGGDSSKPAGEGGAPAPGGGAVVSVAADPSGELAYQQRELTARAGQVTIEFENASPVQHDVKIAQGERQVGGTAIFSEGTRRAAVELQPGSYTFYCSVPGHRAAGMQGQLSVR
jgi:plastocyanin